jgi:predicted DNA-binding protein
MAGDSIYSIRFGRAFRERLEKKAKRRNQSIAAYLKDLAEADLSKDEQHEEAVSKAALEAFDRFAGGSSFDPVTSEEIDRIVYGEE